MPMLIAGEVTTAQALAETGAGGDLPRIWSPSADGGSSEPGSSDALAHALTEFEAEVAGQQVDSVLLADASDGALAAALVASKLLIPLVAVREASEDPSPNGRLIAQLAGAYTEAR